jgi:hypothetical protein
MSPPRSILVTGDFIVDHHLYEGRRHHYADDRSPGVTVVQAPGGAALIHQLLRREDGGDDAGKGCLLPDGWQSRQAVTRPAQPPPSQVAYALWRPQPGQKKDLYWRVAEAMGFGPAKDSASCHGWEKAGDLPSSAEILVVSDGGMGFRKNEACWNDLPFRSVRWIVCKTELPDFAGAFWNTLASHRDRLIVVISASQLRRGDARVSKGLSWEATLLDLQRELSSGTLKRLTEACAHLVIGFETEAALWIDLSQPEGVLPAPQAHFIFDPPVVETDREREIAGTAFGLTSCLAAGVVWSLTAAWDNTTPVRLTEGIEGGLSAMRDLLERGHGPAEVDAARPAGFPAARLAEVIQSPRHLFSRSYFPWDDSLTRNGWSLLKQAAPDMAARARLVAIHGDIALHNVPHLQIGNLFTADRHEIESLRTLIQNIVRYKEPAEKGKKPLSIGVFGPPGSGKSFAVEEIARRFFDKDAWLVFNLSQFKDETDLIGAFHQIRDKALKGMIPIAFFDEFDSQNLRWLQYLLAPMQDGSFQEGQITHPIGKCVCVFAGGTSFTFETFTPAGDRTVEETDEERRFRLAKGPDFSSRLDAALEVSGPNPRLKLPLEGTAFDPKQHTRSGSHFFARDEGDDYFAIRRARAIRYKLNVPPEEHLESAPGLLDALLRVSGYTHGSRSLEKILESLKTCRPGRVCPSALPPPGQLGMHTDAEEFRKLLEAPQPITEPPALTAPQVEAVAAAVHEAYRSFGRRHGWLDAKKDIDYHAMPDLTGADDATFSDEQVTAWGKESNRQAAHRMTGLLALAGLSLASALGVSPKPATAMQMRLESILELLAREEHEGWLQWHFRHGWKFNKERKDKLKRHHLLIPYSSLEDADKNKDRSQVRQLPDFANAASLRVIPA